MAPSGRRIHLNISVTFRAKCLLYRLENYISLRYDDEVISCEKSEKKDCLTPPLEPKIYKSRYALFSKGKFLGGC